MAIPAEEPWTGGDFVIARLTAEDGSQGVGEAFVWLPETGVSPAQVIDAVAGGLARYVLGASPFDVERLRARMDANVARSEVAKGLLDIACYDLMGHVAGRPACDFMGGRGADALPLAALIPLARRRARWLDLALAFQKGGTATFRLKLGRGVEADRAHRRRGARGARRRARACASTTTRPTRRTRRCARSQAIAPFGIDCAEQPVRADDWLGMARVQRAVAGAADGARGLLLAHRLHGAARARRRRRARRQHRAARAASRRRCARSTTPRARGLGTVLHNQPLGIASAAQVHLGAARASRARPRHGALRPRDARGRPDRRAARLLGRPRARARGPGPRRHARRGRARSLRDGAAPWCWSAERGATRGGPAALYTRRRDRDARARAPARRGARDARRPHRRRRRRRRVSRRAARRRRRATFAARRPRRPRAAAGLHRHAPAPDRAALLRPERRSARRARASRRCRTRCAAAAAALPDGRVAGRPPARGRGPRRAAPARRAAELDAACRRAARSSCSSTTATAPSGNSRARSPPPASTRATRRPARRPHRARRRAARPPAPAARPPRSCCSAPCPRPSLERLRETARSSFARLSACGITSAGVILQTDEEGPGGAAGRARVARAAAPARRGALRDLRDPGRAQRRRGASPRARRRCTTPPPAAASAASRSSPTAPSGAAPPACASPSRIAPASAAS